MEIERHDLNSRRSRIVKYNGMCFLSGQFSDSGGDIAQQTQETVAKIDHLLRRAGTSKSRLLTAQIWLRDMADPDMHIEVVVSAAL